MSVIAAATIRQSAPPAGAGTVTLAVVEALAVARVTESTASSPGSAATSNTRTAAEPTSRAVICMAAA